MMHGEFKLSSQALTGVQAKQHRPTRHQTVSKLCFWRMLALQVVDFIRQHFWKIDFLHSLALQPTASSVRSSVAPASGSG